jgi:hypothetical protein
MNQEALYLEADEDITSAIDKLHKTVGDTVQIVVPKRSTLLQSIINLKLLKKRPKPLIKSLFWLLATAWRWSWPAVWGWRWPRRLTRDPRSGHRL